MAKATASKKVAEAMREMKKGKLRSGSGAKVTNPKQAIAIGLSEAREAGANVPKPSKKGNKKSVAKKAASKKAVAKKTAKKSPANKATTKTVRPKKAATKK